MSIIAAQAYFCRQPKPTRLHCQVSVQSPPVPLPAITIFDIETTGLDPRKGHRIIEIAGVRVENGEILRERTFESFINPEREIPLEAKQINKISDELVANAPTIDVVLPQFLEFATGSILLAHNAQFDFGFLQSEKESCWGYIELPECLCSMRLSQNLYPREFRHNLDMICRRFNLVHPQENRHRALADALLTAEAVLRMVNDNKLTSIQDLRKRASLSAPVAK